MYATTIGNLAYHFITLKELLAKASPLRSGDELAGIAASNDTERIAAQITLADVPLDTFLKEPVIDFDDDDVTRLIFDNHDVKSFSEISHHTIGSFREFLLDYHTTGDVLKRISPGITPEMAAGVSKIMRNQDLISVASKCSVISKFRNTLGLNGRISTRLQPNHPTDNPKGIAASILDGLLMGCGDAVIGINPAMDNLHHHMELLMMLDHIIHELQIPTQSCILSHVTTTLAAIEKNAPVDLCFQSIGGTQKTNNSFGVTLSMLKEAQDGTLSLKRGTVGNQVMYFETGQGSSLSANAHHGVDQQTCEARAYAVARCFNPLLVNTVVGFIGPEYLYNGKQIIRAGLEDHFCGKLLGLPMGCDVCYTNHAEADQDDIDNLLTLLSVAGCTYFMAIPGADDIMLNYQSTSFHDALYIRNLLNRRPAPEFEAWLKIVGVINDQGQLQQSSNRKLLKMLSL